MNFLVLLLLTQTPQAVNISDPTTQSKKVTTTTGAGKVALDINCVSGCSGGAGGGSGGASLVWVDGGRLTADEGLGPDGGVFAVYVVNSAASSAPSYINASVDGGVVGVIQFQSRDGGTDWPVEAKITNSPTVYAVIQFDGGEVTAHVDNFPATQAVTGTFFQATQPVSGTVTANAGTGTMAVSLATAPTTPVTGTFFQTTQPVSLASAPTTAVTNAGLTNLDVALSTRTKPADQQHTIIDSSSTITVTGGLTDAQLRASAVPVSLSSTTVTGTVAVSAASLPLPAGASTESTLAKIPVAQASTTSGQSGGLVQGAVTTGAPTYVTAQTNPLSLTTAGALRVDGSGATQPISGTVTANAGTGTMATSLATLPALVAGSAVIGHVINDASSAVIGHVIADTGSTTAVTGSVTVAQATGTSLHAVLDTTSTTAVTQATGTNLHVVVDTAPSTAVTGTVTANAGTNLNTSALALDATLTGGTQKTKIVDTGGTNVATVKAASTAAVATDTALVVAQAPNGGNPCQNPSATVVGLSGVTSGTASVQLVAISGTNKIYICSLNVTGVSGTTPTFKLQYGTAVACATGTTAIIGAFTSTANTVFSFWGTAGVAVTPAGQALCYLQTGTTPINNYNLTYVQAP